MTAKIAGADLITFGNLTTLEQQAAFLAGLLLTAQNTYNAANPSNLKNVVAVSPSYATRIVAIQFQFPIEGDSVLQPLHENVTEAIPVA